MGPATLPVVVIGFVLAIALQSGAPFTGTSTQCGTNVPGQIGSEQFVLDQAVAGMQTTSVRYASAKAVCTTGGVKTLVDRRCRPQCTHLGFFAEILHHSSGRSSGCERIVSGRFPRIRNAPILKEFA